MFKLANSTPSTVTEKCPKTFSSRDLLTGIMDENMGPTDWTLLQDGLVAHNSYAVLADLPSRELRKYVPINHQSLGKYATLKDCENSDSVCLDSFNFENVQHLIITPTWTKDLTGVSIPNLVSITLSGDFTTCKPLDLGDLKCKYLHLHLYKDNSHGDEPYLKSLIGVGIKSIRFTRCMMDLYRATDIVNITHELDVLMFCSVGKLSGQKASPELTTRITEVLGDLGCYASESSLGKFVNSVAKLTGIIRCRTLVYTGSATAPHIFTHIDRTSVRVVAHNSYDMAKDVSFYNLIPNLETVISAYTSVTSASKLCFIPADCPSNVHYTQINGIRVARTFRSRTNIPTYTPLISDTLGKLIVYCGDAHRSATALNRPLEIGSRSIWDQIVLGPEQGNERKEELPESQEDSYSSNKRPAPEPSDWDDIPSHIQYGWSDELCVSDEGYQ